MGEQSKASAKLGMVSSALGAVNMAGQMLGIGQRRQDRRQVRQQGKLQELQIKGQKEMADYQQAQQMDMWNKTNYGAQVEHLKNAGLNPALIYGNSGGGGATTGAGIAGGVSGGEAANAAATQQAGTQAQAQSQQMAMMNAQMGLINAQTENVKADTAGKEKTPDNISADTGLKVQGTEESKSRTELNQIQARIAQIDEKLKGESLEDQLTIIEYTAEKLLGERDEAWAKGNIAQATQTQQIKLINQQLTNKALEAIAIKSGIEVNKAKINEITNDIQRKWEELNMNTSGKRWEHEDRLTAIKEYTKTSLQTAGIIAAGNVVGDVVRIATRQVPKGKRTITENSKGEWTDQTVNYK